MIHLSILQRVICKNLVRRSSLTLIWELILEKETPDFTPVNLRLQKWPYAEHVINTYIRVCFQFVAFVREHIRQERERERERECVCDLLEDRYWSFTSRCLSTYIYIFVCLRIFISVCLSASIFTHTHIYIYMYTHPHTHTLTHIYIYTTI